MRLAGAALCALATGVGAALLPFWPPGLIAALALAGRRSVGVEPARRAGAWRSSLPLFPLGNVAQGAAIAWAAIAVAWLALSWRRPREGLVFCFGPLLAPLACSRSSRSRCSSSATRRVALSTPWQRCSPRRSSPGSRTPRCR